MAVKSSPITPSRSSSNTTTFPLLNLPPEIRIRILSFSLLPIHHLTLPTLKTSAQTYLSLQLTSHLIHAEARLWPFQCFPLAQSATFGSNTAATLKILRKLRGWQIRCIRRVEVEVLGSVFEGCEVGRVIRLLRDGTEGSTAGAEGNSVNPDSSRAFAPGFFRGIDDDIDVIEQQNRTSECVNQQHDLYADEMSGARDSSASELRELDIKITARDVMAPTAESVVGMEKMLDLESSPLFEELVAGVRDNKFPRLRNVTVSVELGVSLTKKYDRDWVSEWRERLSHALNCPKIKSESEIDIGIERSGKVPVNVQVDFRHTSPDADVMQAYFIALGGGDERWDFGPASTQVGQMSVAMMSMGAPAVPLA